MFRDICPMVQHTNRQQNTQNVINPCIKFCNNSSFSLKDSNINRRKIFQFKQNRYEPSIVRTESNNKVQLNRIRSYPNIYTLGSSFLNEENEAKVSQHRLSVSKNNSIVMDTEPKRYHKYQQMQTFQPHSTKLIKTSNHGSAIFRQTNPLTPKPPNKIQDNHQQKTNGRELLNKYQRLLEQNNSLKKIIVQEYYPMKNYVQKMQKEHNERKFLIQKLQKKVQQLASSLKNQEKNWRKINQF